MKQSTETLEILKNFSSINSNICIEPGSTLKTISSKQNILAEATVAEKFKHEITIWDLHQLLGVVSLFDDPDFDFQDKHVVVGDGKRKVKYFYAAKEVLTLPKKGITTPDAPIKFRLTKDILDAIAKGSAVLQAPDLLIQSDDGTHLELNLTDMKSDTNNTYTFEIPEWTPTDVPFKMVMAVENLKFLSGDYDVSVCEKLITEWNHAERDLTYWVAMHQNSKYGE